MMWMIHPRVPAEKIQVKPPKNIHSSPRRNLPLYIWPSPGSRKLRIAAVPGLRIGMLGVAVKSSRPDAIARRVPLRLSRAAGFKTDHLTQRRRGNERTTKEKRC